MSTFFLIYLVGYWFLSLLLIRMSIELRETGINYPRLGPIFLIALLWPYALYLALTENATY